MAYFANFHPVLNNFKPLPPPKPVALNLFQGLQIIENQNKNLKTINSSIAKTYFCINHSRYNFCNKNWLSQKFKNPIINHFKRNPSQ